MTANGLCLACGAVTGCLLVPGDAVVSGAYLDGVGWLCDACRDAKAKRIENRDRLLDLAVRESLAATEWARRREVHFRRRVPSGHQRS